MVKNFVEFNNYLSIKRTPEEIKQVFKKEYDDVDNFRWSIVHQDIDSIKLLDSLFENKNIFLTLRDLANYKNTEGFKYIFDKYKDTTDKNSLSSALYHAITRQNTKMFFDIFSDNNNYQYLEKEYIEDWIINDNLYSLIESYSYLSNSNQWDNCQSFKEGYYAYVEKTKLKETNLKNLDKNKKSLKINNKL